MKDYTVNMFQIPLAHYVVRDWEFKKQQLLSLIEQSNFLFDKAVKTTYGESETEELNKLFNNIFKEEINLFVGISGLDYYKIEQSWFEVEDSSMFHLVNNYGPGISAICFIEFNHEEHIPVHFLSPFNDILTGNSNNYVPEVYEGSIIFFPSFVNQYTIPNPSKKQRTIASFNIKIR
jgi:hypothetical protein